MNTTFLKMLRRLVQKGNLTVILSSGEQAILGDGSGDPVTVRTLDEEAEKAILHDPGLRFGEMYVEGRLVIDEGNIFDVISMVKANGLEKAATISNTVTALLHVAEQQIKSRLPVNRNKHNVAHHYDLDGKLFDLFLDQDWQYSCAYFDPPGISLDEAQTAKKRHIAAKLLLEPGQTVLEVGSGWGGMAMYLAEFLRRRGHRHYAQRRAAEGLPRAGRKARACRIASASSCRTTGRWRTGSSTVSSRSACSSMSAWPTTANFFTKMAELLAPKGVMLLHSIGQAEKPWATNPWIEKYIFPGGYMPALSEVVPAIEKARLMIRDIEILPMHYAHTLRAWRERFTARKDEAIRLYDERFFRMWEFYLAASETAFIYDKLSIFQIQLSHEQDAVPYTRNYIGEREATLREFEKTRPPLEPVEF